MLATQIPITMPCTPSNDKVTGIVLVYNSHHQCQ